MHGPGEYFALTPDTTYSYSKESGQVILTFVINNNSTKKIPGICYVVDNPLDNDYTFCLPLLVVHYKNDIQKLENLGEIVKETTKIQKYL